VAEWVERLGKSDVPFAHINKVSDVVEDPQVKHLGLMVPVENPHAAKQSVRPAVQFDGQRATGVFPAPLINEHGEAIRAQLAASSHWPQR
jgi:crotonobetainyl-CoA:carnitine CoA-transferase CaiB-like acyl-CoA transferase